MKMSRLFSLSKKSLRQIQISDDNKHRNNEFYKCDHINTISTIPDAVNQINMVIHE